MNLRRKGLSWFPLTAAPVHTDVCTVDTTQVPSAGLFVFYAFPGCVEPTDSMTARRAYAVGVCTVAGSPGGEVAVSDEVTIQLSTEGGRPYPGGLIWLEAAMADGNTAAGKGTATKPSKGVALISRPIFSGLPNKSVVPVAVVVSVDWPARTAVVQLLTPCGPTPPDLQDVTWDSTKLTGWGASNYLSAAGTTAGLDFKVNESWIHVFTVDSVYAGSGQMYLNCNSSFTKGWSVNANTTLDVSIYGAAGTVATLQFDDLKLNPNNNCLIATFAPGGAFGFGTVNGAMNGVPALAPVDLTSAPAAPDGSCTFTMGVFPSIARPWPGGLIAWAKIAGAYTLADATRLSREQVFPTIPADQYHLPNEVLLDPRLVVQWHAEGGIGVYGPSFAFRFNLTLNGTPISTDIGQTEYRNLANYMLDCGPVAVDSLGCPHGISSSCIETELTTATSKWAHLARCRSPGDWDDVGGGAFAGTTGQSANTWSDAIPSSIGIPSHPALPYPDGNERAQWHFLHDVFAAPAARSFRLAGGLQSKPILPSTLPLQGWAREDFALTGFVAERGLAFKTQSTVTCTKRIVIDGDDGFTGKACGQAGGDNGVAFTRHNIATLLRADYAGRISNSSCVLGSMNANYVAGCNSMVPRARELVLLGREVPGVPVVVLLATGWRDYQLAQSTAAQFGARLAALADALHALEPTWSIVAMWPTQDGWFTTANANGETLNQFIAQITAVCAARAAWMGAPLNASTPNTITYTDGTRTSEDIAGLVAKKNNIEAALVALGLF